MSVDELAPAPPASQLDEDDRLRPEFVRQVLAAVEAGDDAAARALVEPLHPADRADLFETVGEGQRGALAQALGDLIDADVIAEMNDYVREGLVDTLGPAQVAEIAAELDTDDAVAMIEDMEADDQAAVLAQLGPEDRAAIENALSYPEETAGRLMQRDLVAVGEHVTVGDIIDRLREDREAAEDFYEIYVVDPAHRPIGYVQLSRLLRTARAEKVADIMVRQQTLIPVDMDQEEVALRFQKYALISAAVIDPAGRLVGMITADDIVHIVQEEASEDVTRLAGAGDGDINQPIHLAVRTRLSWLIVNLGTAMLAASVVGMFQAEIAALALLAVLMPIVSGMGGNAGTQTLAVTVRALATNQLTSANTARMVVREITIALANGAALGTIIGLGVTLIFGNPTLGMVIAAAMAITNLAAGLAGFFVPVLLDRMDVDPAVSSAVFVTATTDIIGFFSFLSLAGAVGLAG